MTEGLNAYLGDRLTLPTAAAALAVVEPAHSTHFNRYDSIPFRIASQKIAKSICLMFASQIDELRALAASYRVVTRGSAT